MKQGNIKWHETCKWECGLNSIVCNNKQRWNKNKCRCEGHIWNPSNCECECDKSCDIGEYLDYQNCTCKKRLVDKLVDECHETINEQVEIIHNKCNSCIVYIVLFSVFFTIKCWNWCLFCLL